MRRSSPLAALRAARAVLAPVGLALFLLGTHYCLVGLALAQPAADAPPSCHAAPAEAEGAAAAPHCAAPAGDASAEGPSRAPCCVALAPATAAEAPRLGVAYLPVLLLFVLAPRGPLAEREVVVLGHGPAPPGDRAIPAAPARAPLSPRAPPLA